MAEVASDKREVEPTRDIVHFERIHILLIEDCGIEPVAFSIRILNDHLSCTDGIGWSCNL